MKKYNIVFMGNPEFGMEVLKYLHQEHNLLLVVTNDNKTLKKTNLAPVLDFAIKNNIKYTHKEKDELFLYLKNFDIDFIVTAAFGQILRKEVLNLPKIAPINVHSSILPKYRGAEPIRWSLINGEKITGVSIIWMNEKMDEGDILGIKEVSILETDNYESLHEKLKFLGKDVIKEVLDSFQNNRVKRIKQNHLLRTYSRKISRSDELIDFSNRGEDICNKVRGMYPLAYININQKEVKILDCFFQKQNVDKENEVLLSKDYLGITCRDGVIYLKKVKPSGKCEMDIKSYLNGINKSNILID